MERLGLQKPPGAFGNHSSAYRPLPFPRSAFVLSLIFFRKGGKRGGVYSHRSIHMSTCTEEKMSEHCPNALVHPVLCIMIRPMVGMRVSQRWRHLPTSPFSELTAGRSVWHTINQSARSIAYWRRQHIRVDKHRFAVDILDGDEKGK